ncbi:MAG: hypothetical protein ABWZ66_11435 [Pyrinomonadaceae bacterium]
MKNLEPEPTEEERELIETLIKYPALEAVYERNAPAGFSGIRQNLLSTVTNLERVIRRGEKSDAERAATVVEACRTAINFLSELENVGKSQPR